MSTWDPNEDSVDSTPNNDSVYVTEGEFHEDPATWARRADDAPRVVVTSDDGEHIRFVIIQQREPLDLKF
ncbi:hypothetical protein KRR26_35695 [Corallococcus sp. M34]|uniref:hypothetical protein n=1 Tax=Citreicoccus inhibens TaxID=2849499 RepID=UPI001C21CCA7|nr:hypothetical protein [Citreicoccus inhibens]MBU8900954.1 hypothetical protein [Citreicoccus inhibens]